MMMDRVKEVLMRTERSQADNHASLMRARARKQRNRAKRRVLTPNEMIMEARRAAELKAIPFSMAQMARVGAF